VAVTGIDVLANLLGLGTIVTAGELLIIEGEIHGIITVIDQELAHFDPADFKSAGHISPGSFGGGDRAPSLTLHHTKAHGVMADTLYGLRADLHEYQQACRDAREFLKDADLTSAGDLTALKNAVEALGTGAQSDQGGAAYSQAQYNHRNDTADGSAS
jgi:hypothetical protein